MPAKKKVKAVDNLNARLSLVVKSGKLALGHRSTLKALRKSQAKLVLISNNCPPLRKSEIEYYCMLAKVMVVPYNGNNIDMGTAVGKFFRVSVMSILDAGDSDILKQAMGTDDDKKK